MGQSCRIVWIMSLIGGLSMLSGCMPSPSSSSEAATEASSELSVTKADANLKTSDKDSKLATLPEEITLSFGPLELEALPLGIADSGWKWVRSIPFGSLGNQPVHIEVYEEPSDDGLLPAFYHGIVKVGHEQYLLRYVAAEITGRDASGPGEKAEIVQKLIPGQSRYELLGSIPLSGNGPGLQAYVVVDTDEGKLYAIECWGISSFTDLDLDGQEEWVIEFEGLHLSWPDVRIIRFNQNRLEVCNSVTDVIRRNQRDYAKLLKDQERPVIRIAAVRNEEESFEDYTYDHGVLRSVNQP
ncbi:hypothetical protein [Paenibacillus hexagrammi]|uniref:Lipoprotein n=1 Tax=Paenibacillus hexagrammi TaxID=2908839 RepID=A0ABY3SI93_9BACL|nr:hypothetical protein [Paenibacillus sp. YPD9-1]UJF32946.1 hypothetical protein L0M14_25770 [Paenibacillus sp. YPD9-1]